MDTHVRTPQDVFMLPQHLVVPPFQRPYVWEKDEQWAPFWQDIRRLAELQIDQPTAEARHFLGAVVVQAQDPVLGGLQASSIIDGQQRLTTLQLLMDAAAAALEEAGHDSLAGQIGRLTHNEEMYSPGAPTRLKLRHSNKDGAAFTEVMDAETPVDHDNLMHASSRIVRAHGYFAEAIGQWLRADSPGHEERAQVLTTALTRGLQLVAISLTSSENSQEIFETLNARGTPLTAADLIRNFVFQRLAADGVDTRAHLDDWPFETEFWEKEVSVGRHSMQRSSLFFNQWLIAQVGEEVSPRATFTRFKQHVDHLGLTQEMTVADLLPRIREHAQRYEAWTVAARDPDRQLKRVELAVYRTRASETEALKPILIWLHEPGRSLPVEVIERVVAMVESWLVRRQLLRLGLGDTGRIVADLIRLHDGTSAGALGEAVERFLSRLDVTGTYWPGDDEVRTALRGEQVFRRFKKSRLRMLLEAVEDRYRWSTNQPQVPRRGYPIEHVLPQKWTTHWPVADAAAEERRAEHVHRLGNLTLLTTSLNSKVSNGPWAAKRQGLQAHDTLLLNSRLLSGSADTWDEQAIDARGEELITQILNEWPVPAGHTGAVLDPHEKSAGWIQVKHLVEAQLLQPGTVLTPRSGAWASQTATVRPDGLLDVDGKMFETPSGAGRHVKGSITNGWTFWTLPDGRRLRDVRTIYAGPDHKKGSGADWAALHSVLEAIPAGHWVDVGACADAVGTASQALRTHMAACAQCTNTHRVLVQAADGSWRPAVADSGALDDSLDLLRSEAAFVDGAPDPACQLSVDAIGGHVEM